MTKYKYLKCYFNNTITISRSQNLLVKEADFKIRKISI